jgi:calcium-translocating P-type ATPase
MTSVEQTPFDHHAGLSSVEATLRRARDGPNRLPTRRPMPAWRRLAAQMVHFFALMLWGAGVLAFVAGMPQLGTAIFVVIVVNGAFAFMQEHRAERAAEHLQCLLPRRATVIRDGIARVIDADELVVDDVLLLGEGDRLSADAELITVRSLRIDTSMLTGESVPEDMAAGDRVLAGTFVVEGEGVAVVRCIGDHTRLAAIARLTQAGRRPHTPLARELDRLVRIIAMVAVLVGLAFFGIAALIGTSVSDSFLFAIGVTVALVPEGLLPTVTLSLAIGGQRMAARNALVRRLEAVETLGSTTFICTDKTGTLTRNEMAVVAAWTPAGPATISGTGYEPTAAIDVDPAVIDPLTRLATAARRCSTGRAELDGTRWVAHGDPMEAALDTFARRLNATLDLPETARFPFDGHRRRMSVVVDGELIVKGAPESVLPRCRDNANAWAAVDELTGRGLRVLAIGVRPADGVGPDEEPDSIECQLTLLGLVGLEDPPRAEAAAAVAACRAAGIRVAMITGDHPRTAAAVAHRVGLSVAGSPILDGNALPDDGAVLGAMLDHDGVVVSRVTPEDKLRIARALQARGHVVAMTGDGVNDGPALQEADIGVAMGRSGTDVAREAADLVLLDDNFATIVTAIEQGRATFANIRRFLTYHLSDNVAELTPFVVWALSGGRIPLALGVLQILALDIGTDVLPALALGAEQPRTGILARPPTRGHLLERNVAARAFGVLGPTEAAVSMAAFLAVFLAEGWRPGDAFPTPVLEMASGAAFAAVVIGQFANAFACRSEHRWPGALGWTSNRLLFVAVGTEVALLGAFMWIPPIADLLGHAPPNLAGWIVALCAAPAVLGVDAVAKRWMRHHGTFAPSPPLDHAPH